ncbi:MAG: DUF4340 domain-containing protein, partial [Oscillospiraceae bacterium]|nr:DUF4340 domain-containing protein [Oscillospiraceae bacterium]
MSSRKLLVTIGALVMLMISAIIGYVAVDRSKTAEETASQAEKDALQLFQFDPDSIDSVTIDNSEGHFQIAAGSGQWELAETDYPDEIRLNTAYVTAVVTYMCDLTAYQKVEADPEKLASYGLDNPVVVTCASGNTAYTLCVGNASVTEEYWYVKRPDENYIYAVDYSEGETLRGGMNYLKNRGMLRSLDVSINAFCLEKGSDTVVDLVKKDGLWVMNAPLKDANVSSALVSSMLTSLTRTEYSGFVATAENPEDLKTYGLDNPAYTLVVKSDDVTDELLFAPQDKTGGGWYVLNKASGQVASMDAQTGSFLELKPEELLIDRLVMLNYSDARSLEVQVDDVSFTMEMDAQAGTCSFNGKDLSGMSENVRTLHRNLYDTVANLTWEELRPDAELSAQDEASGAVSEETASEAASEDTSEAASG